MAEVLVPFMATGLRENERCLWITSEPLSAAEAHEALGRSVPDLDERIARGQIQILDYRDWYCATGQLGPEQLIASWLTSERKALADGYAGLRITGNTSWLRPEDWTRFVEYEVAAHEAFHTARILALCSYSLERCQPDHILDLLRSHQFALVRRNGVWDVVRSATMTLAAVEREDGTLGIAKAALLETADRVEEPPHPARTAHAVRFFHDDDYPADRIAEFVAVALRDGAAGLVLATRNNLYRISSALRAQGIDVAEKVESGQLVLRDAKQIAGSVVEKGVADQHAFDALIGGTVRRAVAAYGRARAYGEVVDVLAHRGDSANALQLELWWNELLEQQAVELLCGYRLESFASASDEAAFRRICIAHTVVEPAQARAEGDAGRMLAELQQSTAALHNEATRRQTIERQHDHLRQSERELRERAHQATDHLARLQRFTSALSEALTVDEIAQVVVTDLTTMFGADRAVLAIAREVDHHTELTLLGHANLTRDQVERYAVIPADSPLPIAVAFRTAAPIWLMTPGEIAERFPSTAMPSDARGMGCVPILSGGRRIGVVAIVYTRDDSAGVEDRALLDDYVCQMALALDRARSYEEAQVARERAEMASRAKDEFLAMLGHELRNPLSPIMNAVQLMRLRAEDVLVRERTIIERQVNHMVRLIDDLLDVSRIARGRVELKTARVELAQVVANAIEIASPLLEERAHKLVTRIPTAGQTIEVDAARFAQVIVNLLTNAARYTPPNGIIEIQSAVGEDRLALSVRDSGVGIAPELLPRIFDIFVQGQQACDRPQGGLGLGLAIARNLVELHGGRLLAASEGLGKGATFTIELPLSVRTHPSHRTENSTLARPEGSKRKILVVDDNIDAANTLGEALVSIGHRVRVAHDGPTALEVALEFRPDLALVDLGLPLMDGYELAERLAAEPSLSNPKLIAVTGYGQDSDRRRSSAAGFQCHLVKPLDFHELEMVIPRLFPPS